MSNTECNECKLDPEKRCEEPNSLFMVLHLMRENIIKEFAEQDFVRVRRCVKCGYFKGCDEDEPKGTHGWCERYDEVRIDYDYCSEAKEK